jgi:HEAT repeats
MLRRFQILTTPILFVSIALAQQPRFQNAKLESFSAAQGLQKIVSELMQKQIGPAWIGYSIPVIPKDRIMCCWDSMDQFRAANGCCSGCRLEREGGTFISGTTDSNCTRLEPANYAFVLLRTEDKKVTKVRIFTPNCPLDAANLPVYWLTEVNPGPSVNLLSDFVQARFAEGSYLKKDPARQAVHAIALHDVPEADNALKKFIAQGQPESLREQAALMLGIERGKTGFEILRAAVKQDPSEGFRKKALLGFSQSEEPEALRELISLAHNDPSSQVRSQALFWLAQKGGRKEAEQITDAIENDPESEVKKKAVFALSQMPRDQGVPLLINVARTNKNPIVRREAIRWLGFSNDPRALEFIEQILTK